jgi:hypothetical protein
LHPSPGDTSLSLPFERPTPIALQNVCRRWSASNADGCLLNTSGCNCRSACGKVLIDRGHDTYSVWPEPGASRPRMPRSLVEACPWTPAAPTSSTTRASWQTIWLRTAMTATKRLLHLQLLNTSVLRRLVGGLQDFAGEVAAATTENDRYLQLSSAAAVMSSCGDRTDTRVDGWKGGRRPGTAQQILYLTRTRSSTHCIDRAAAQQTQHNLHVHIILFLTAPSARR